MGVLCLLGIALSAQQETASFEARGPRREVTEGARFEVTFVLKNETAQRFIPPDFGGLSIRSGPAEVRSAGFANGKAYTQQAWVYELEAKEAGAYTIGPAIVQTARHNLRSQPLSIRVVKSSVRRPPKDSPASGGRYFVVADVRPRRPWLGQQAIYSLRLYTQVGVEDADLIELPDFEGFYVQERRRFDTRVQYEKIGGKTYAVRTLYEASLFAQRNGALTIGPARLRLLTGDPKRGLFGATSDLVASAPVSVEVRPLPEPQPENFCGGVGHYEWSVSADKQALTTDDVLTLSARIQGNGDARRFLAPRFALPAAFEVFDPETRQMEEYETGDEFVHTHTLTYAILPKQPGTYFFTPEMSFFDPDSGRYRVLRAEAPVQIAVVPGENYGKSAASPDTLTALEPPEEMPWWESLEEIPEPWAIGMAGITALLILGWLAALIWQRQRRKAVKPDEEETPRLKGPTPQKADWRLLHTQLQQLRHPSSQAPPETFYHEMLKWIEKAVAAYLHTVPSLLGRTEALHQLAARGLPAPAVEALAYVWERCERAVYAHVVLAEEMQTCWEKAHQAWESLSRGR